MQLFKNELGPLIGLVLTNKNVQILLSAKRQIAEELSTDKIKKNFFLNHQHNTFKNLTKMIVDIFLNINNIQIDMVNDSFTHKQNIQIQTKTQVSFTKFSRNTLNSYLILYFQNIEKRTKAPQFI